jgi:hypothetical protein
MTMYRIISKKTKKEQIVSDKTWAELGMLDRQKRYNVLEEITEKSIKKPIPEELIKPTIIKSKKIENND